MKPEIIPPRASALAALLTYVSLGAAGGAVAACVDPADFASLEQAIIPTADCSVPEAIPDDGLDDREAIQLRLDVQRCALLGPGVYDVSADLGAGQDHVAALHLRGGMKLSGQGPATVLHFYGTATGAWDGVQISGSTNTLSELTLDSADLVSNDEQTHMVEVVGNSHLGATDSTTITGNAFNHPGVTGVRKGDCVRLLGSPDYQVKRTLIAENQFTVCRRSAIEVQRQVVDYAILTNAFTETTDQMIDGEQSGQAFGGRGIIAGNTFTATSGNYAIAMSATELAELVIADNVISGQGVFCYNCRGFTFTGNVVTARPDSAVAALTVVRSSGRTVIAGNVITRAGTVAGAVVSIAPLNEQYPGATVINGNHLKQETGAFGLNVLSVRGFAFTGNILELADGLVAPHGLRISRNTTTDPMNDGVVITGNQLLGPWQIGVTLQSTLRATLGHNAMDATPGAKGLSCNTSVTGPVVSSGNNWTASSCAQATAGGL